MDTTMPTTPKADAETTARYLGILTAAALHFQAKELSVRCRQAFRDWHKKQQSTLDLDQVFCLGYQSVIRISASHGPFSAATPESRRSIEVLVQLGLHNSTDVEQALQHLF
jgi:hypothetical protein